MHSAQFLRLAYGTVSSVLESTSWYWAGFQEFQFHIITALVLIPEFPDPPNQVWEPMGKPYMTSVATLHLVLSPACEQQRFAGEATLLRGDA